MMVRGELDYLDQVPRRLAYEKTHPNTEILYISPHWQAIIREDDDGMTIVTRHSLKHVHTVGRLVARVDLLHVQQDTGQNVVRGTQTPPQR